MNFRSFLRYLLLTGVTFVSAGADAPAPPSVVLPPEVRFLEPAEVQRHLVQSPDTVIIDVRTEEERRTRSFVLNSLHFDYFHGEETLDAIAKLDRNKPSIVYCAIGSRAKLIAVEMHRMGFKNILLLKGGFDAWTATGQPIAKP
jgi:rhodanese-related sulfurtransferase